jgi:hypothetical protein
VFPFDDDIFFYCHRHHPHHRLSHNISSFGGKARKEKEDKGMRQQLAPLYNRL